MPTVTRPEVDIYYEISGNGPPLLLIPGMLSDSATWLPVLPFLEPHFTVIRPDNRATGRMQNCGPFTLPDCADDLAALVEHLDLQELHVAGHSMGGYLTLMLADRIPRRLASLTLLASAPANGQRNFKLFEHALILRKTSHLPADFWLRNLFPWLMSPRFFKNPMELDGAMAAAMAYPFAQSIEAFERQINALTGFRSSAADGVLPCRIQAVLAAQDLLFPVEDSRKTLKGIPDLRFEVIQDAAHSIHWEQPQAVAQNLIGFALER